MTRADRKRYRALYCREKYLRSIIWKCNFVASRSKCGDVCFASFESSSIINVFHFIPAPQGRREKLGLKANLGRMDLTLNIYPEVRIGLEPNLRQIEFRFFVGWWFFNRWTRKRQTLVRRSSATSIEGMRVRWICWFLDCDPCDSIFSWWYYVHDERYCPHSTLQLNM